MLRVATDIGGTFTDLVFVTPHGEVVTGKSHTTPAQFEKGVMDVISASHIKPAAFASFVHGTTIVINAVTEKKGAKVGLLTTEGFRDIIEIGRGARPDFFNLEYRKPQPFVPRYLRREVKGRTNYKGIETTPLELSTLPAILDDFRAEGVEAVAISFINSYANPAHEEAAMDRVKELWPEVSVTASHQITREWREYERTNTAVLSAYVQPVAHRYLDRLTSALYDAGMRCTPYIMQSNCGVDTVKSARQVPITMIESGPASGIWGAAALSRLVGEPDAIAIDIGGTTAKCALITSGQVKLNTNYQIGRHETSAGYPVMVPVVDLLEIGNGGGSIAWVDAFQRLHVGPQSAGAVPGPVAYGIGGTEPTTTDANLALGCINPHFFCGGTLEADMDAVERALDKLAATLGPLPDSGQASSGQRTDRQEVARSIVRIANNNMVNAIKLISINRGHDPRDFTLIAFGGGGGMHACALAKELGIKKVVIPKQSSVFSAWGMLLSDLRRDFLQTQIVDLSAPGAAEQIDETLRQLEAKALQEFAAEDINPAHVHFLRHGRCRYQNQEHSVEIVLPDGDPSTGSGRRITAAQIEAIRRRFDTDYEREYTYRLDAPVELVAFHVVAMVEVDKLKPEKLPTTGRKLGDAIKGQREVDYVEAGIHRATIYDGDALEPGMHFVGPAIIEESGATTVIPPGLPCHVDDYGDYHIHLVPSPSSRQAGLAHARGSTRDLAQNEHCDPITLAIIQSSLQAATDEMFAALRHTAMSAIIYEVLDMGTGITDKDGELVGSGAGIPAFVGVLDKTVKRVLEKYDQPGDPSTDSGRRIEPGDIFITNDPYTGGVTHLNDAILTMPVFVGDEIVAWSANIAHWNDVGGMVPGSMSTDATEIFQEGLILSAVKLFSRGQPIRPVFEILTANCRMPDFLTGDLWAGVASVRVGERRVLEIVDKYGKDVFLHAVQEYLNYGEQVSLAALRRLPKGKYSLVEKQDAGPDYKVTVEIRDDAFIIDLRDNPDQDKGPFNMSRDEAVVACQMAFKGIVSPERLSNGGTFRPLKALTRYGSIFDPIYPAAQGIYYELTIRVHDLIWCCLAQHMPDRLPAGGFASVCGTLFGGVHPDTGRTYAVIEPELGGWGGSPISDGNSGQFCALHGETYNCPAEVAEARYGVTVDYLSFHDEDGGAGLHRGGKGVRIDYRIKSDNAWLTVAYTRSKVPPWPLKGGQPGSPNHILIVRANGKTERHSVVSGLTLNTDDVIRVMTATGAGWGDPMERPLELVEQDLKNGYITLEQAKRYFGWDRRRTSA